MAGLSISHAWEETKARIVADGRLMAIVAAALIALPGVISGVIAPDSTRAETSILMGLIILIFSLLALVGQLAIIRLAIGSAVSVGEAISHGARRMPIYVLAGILLTLGLIVAAIPLVAVLIAAGVPVDRSHEQAMLASPVTIVLLSIYFVFLFFVCVRMLMSSPVASEEAAGPIQILRRSWDLTRGHWWRLFGFILLFLVGAIIAIAAVHWLVSFVAVLLFGPIEPLSGSALIVAIVDSSMNAAVTVVLAVMLARIYLQLGGREAIDVGVPNSGT